MDWIKKGLNYFIFGNFFIAVVAVVMTVSSYFTFGLKINIFLLAFVFAGTLCSYSLHWFLSEEPLPGKERENWTLSHKKLLVSSFLLSIPACIFLFLKLENHPRMYASVLGLATFLYTAPKIPFRPFILLRKIAFGKTFYLAFVWTFTTVILPLSEWNLEKSTEVWLFFLYRLSVLLPICVLFDYKDKESDLQQGLSGLVYRLSWKQTIYLIFGCLFVFFLSCIGLTFGNARWIYGFWLALPGIALLLLLPQYEKPAPDYYYYIYLDGLMMGSGLISWFV